MKNEKNCIAVNLIEEKIEKNQKNRRKNQKRSQFTGHRFDQMCDLTFVNFICEYLVNIFVLIFCVNI